MASPLVLCVGHRLQMYRVDASAMKTLVAFVAAKIPAVAEVIDLKAFRDRAVRQFVRESVSQVPSGPDEVSVSCRM
jgi:hypothetical protein